MPQCTSRIFTVHGLALAVLISSAVSADGVTDSIDEALQYYKDGQYTDAASSLTNATQLIQQKKGEQITTVFPQPLDGWTATEAGSQSAGAAIMGGGLTAERTYSKDSSSVTIEIIADSPVIQDMITMFNNPMFLAADSGKLEKVGTQKAIVKYNTIERDGDVKMVIAKRFMVTVTGLDISKEELMEYAGNINFAKLKSLP